MRRRHPGPLLAALFLGVIVAATTTSCGGDSEPTPPPRSSDPFSYRDPPPLAPKVTREGRRGTVEVERISYAAADGPRVPALMALPARGRSPRACLIYQGGLGTTPEDADFLWPAVADLGASTFTILPRDTGSRAEDSKQLDRVVRDPERLAASIRGTVTDLRRGVDYLVSRKDCDPKRIGYLGVSQGGLTGALLAGSDRRIRATVLMVTGGGWNTILRDSRLLVPKAADDADARREAVRTLAPYDPARWVAKIAPRALLLVNGSKDPDTSTAAARNLRRAAGPGRETIEYDGGHDPFRAPRADDVPNRVADFLERELLAP